MSLVCASSEYSMAVQPAERYWFQDEERLKDLSAFSRSGLLKAWRLDLEGLKFPSDKNSKMYHLMVIETLLN